MGNLTVRIDDKLKREAEEACKRLDLTMSQVVRRALKAMIKEAGSSFDRMEKVNLVREEADFSIAEASQRAVSVARRKRIAELQALEKRNELNRVTREELHRLRLAEIAMDRG